MTRHSNYDPTIHSITLLEATEIAGGASGKAGGLLAKWATPKCLAPLSFKAHAELANEHSGHKTWGYRSVYCAEVELQARNLTKEGNDTTLGSENNSDSQKTCYPSNLDWLVSDSVKSYDEVGNTENSAQVNPYMFTISVAKLAEEKGVKIVIGTATAIN